MKKLLILISITLCSTFAFARNSARGFCEQGATVVVTAGLNSTTLVQGSFPSCTVTVSLNGGGLATIFSDNSGTPLANPFTATSSGQWQWYADNGRYSVTLTGGGGPVISVPDILLSDSTAISGGICTLGFSATPTFNAALCSTFSMTLTGNVTSSTISGGVPGQIIAIALTQGGGGPFTFAWPGTAIQPPVLTPTAAKSENFTLVELADTNWHFIGMGEYPLNQISSLTGTGTTNVMQASPTITTPTLTSPTTTGTDTGTETLTNKTLTSPIITGNITLSGSGVICWNSDTGITRSAAKSFKIGDCAGSSDALLTLGSITSSGPNVLKGLTTTCNVEGIQYVDDANTCNWAGADVCAQEKSAEAVLQANGGVIDMRGLIAATLYNCTGPWTIGSATKAIYLRLPPANLLVTSGIVVPGSSFLVGMNTFGAMSRLQTNTAGSDAVKWTGSFGGMQDVFLLSGANKAALHLVASGATSIIGNNFRNLRVACNGSAAGSIGLEMTADSNTALVSQNSFGPFASLECETDIKADTTGTVSPTDNWVRDINIASSSGLGIAGISMNGANGGVNHFGPGIIAGKATGILVNGGSFNQFTDMRTESNTTNINDAGVGTMFFGQSVDVNTITITDTTITLLGNGNAAFQQLIRGALVPTTVIVGTQYNNATTTFSTVTNMGSFSIAANKSYTLSCTIYFSGSAATAGPKFQFTGPAAPTLVVFGVEGATNTTAYGNAGGSGFSAPLTVLGTLGATATNFVAHVTAGIQNGANAGTVALQAAANGAGTLSIQAPSFCTFQ